MKYNLSYDIMNKIERCVNNMVNQMKILDVLKKSKIYFEDFISRSTYHSNAIEGSTLSFAETYALLFDNKNIVKLNRQKLKKFTKLSIINML